MPFSRHRSTFVLKRLDFENFFDTPVPFRRDYAKYLETVSIRPTQPTCGLWTSRTKGRGTDGPYLSFLEKKCAENKLRKKELRQKSLLGQVNLSASGTASDESAEARCWVMRSRTGGGFFLSETTTPNTKSLSKYSAVD
jgi:hypothetical protein